MYELKNTRWYYPTTWNWTNVVIYLSFASVIRQFLIFVCQCILIVPFYACKICIPCPSKINFPNVIPTVCSPLCTGYELKKWLAYNWKDRWSSIIKRNINTQILWVVCPRQHSQNIIMSKVPRNVSGGQLAHLDHVVSSGRQQ